MITGEEAVIIATWIEGFLFGLYSGIFALYLQCPSKKSRTATVLFYALCLLYVLSAVNFVGDVLTPIIESHITILSLQLPLDSQVMVLYNLTLVQTTASGLCDFLAQSILIYRCWIVWGQNIRVVIIPSFLAIAYLATWLAPDSPASFIQDQISNNAWGVTLTITSFALSMAVNTLVTGLIIFKILKVFSGVKTTSVERTLGLTGGKKLQHVIFVIIESGLALFIIQLIRLVCQLANITGGPSDIFGELITVINQMANGITPTIILVRVSMGLSFDDKESFMEASTKLESLHFNNPQSDSGIDQSTTGHSSQCLEEMEVTTEPIA